MSARLLCGYIGEGSAGRCKLPCNPGGLWVRCENGLFLPVSSAAYYGVLDGEAPADYLPFCGDAEGDSAAADRESQRHLRHQRAIMPRDGIASRLLTVDPFVLDNSLRETTVAQVNGHTLETKIAIWEMCRSAGLREFISGLRISEQGNSGVRKLLKTRLELLSTPVHALYFILKVPLFSYPITRFLFIFSAPPRRRCLTLARRLVPGIWPRNPGQPPPPTSPTHSRSYRAPRLLLAPPRSQK